MNGIGVLVLFLAAIAWVINIEVPLYRAVNGDRKRLWRLRNG